MKIAICDDNPSFVEEIKKRIRKRKIPIKGLMIDCYYSGVTLLDAFLAGMRYDIVFIDIEMEERRAGIEIAREITTIDSSLLLYYMTSHSEDISAALEVPHFQFILKSRLDEDFDRQFSRGLQQIQRPRDYIEVITDNGQVLFAVSEIYAVTSRSSSAIIHTKNNQALLAMPLYRVMEKLSDFNFERCRKNCYVNIDHVRLPKKKTVLMDNGVEFDISARYYKSFYAVYFVQKTIQ